MIEKIKMFMANFLKGNLFIIFLLLVIVGTALGIFFTNILNNPDNEKILNIVNKFSTDDYTLPYYVAERYIIWLNMRQFLFWLYFCLTLFT